MSAVLLALAGLQWNKPQEGMNVYFLLDRSQSVPPSEQGTAHMLLASAEKQSTDKAGLMVFGTDAGIELSLTPIALQTKHHPDRRRCGSHRYRRGHSPRHGGVPGDRPKAARTFLRRQ